MPVNASEESVDVGPNSFVSGTGPALEECRLKSRQFVDRGSMKLQLHFYYTGTGRFDEC